MDPRDFLAVADTLKHSGEEAGMHTAVSRAYYAVFNHIRGYLATNNVELPDYQIHIRLRRSIKNSGVQGAKTVARKMGDLWDDRREADYDMQSTLWTGATCDTIVDKAREALTEFLSFQGEELVSGVRRYLVDVERLTR
jgi:uncharacterized protein (UPF0332 family)